MAKVVVIHKPACATSRGAVQILEENGVEYETILYLQKKITRSKLVSWLNKLGLKPVDLIRVKEPVFEQNFAGKNQTDEEWIQAMINFPELIERPIIIKGQRAIIARPLEKIYTFLRIKPAYSK